MPTEVTEPPRARGRIVEFVRWKRTADAQVAKEALLLF